MKLIARVVCWVLGHDDVRMIKGLTPDREWEAVSLRAVSLAARLDSMYLWCRRCGRRVETPVPPGWR